MAEYDAEKAAEMLRSDLRLARVKEKEAAGTIAKLQETIRIAHKLVVLAIQHNHSDMELEGEMNLISYVLGAEIDRFGDDEIPF